MTKELELEVYDIVKIVDGNGSICLESINEIHNDENGKLAFTDNFVIDLKKVEVNCVSNGDPYQLEMVWRLDKNRNYTMIYSIQHLESIDNANPSKALEELNEIIEYITKDKKVKYKATILFDCEIIKDALLNAEKLKKAWEIVKEKGVDVATFNTYQTVIEYNWSIRFEKYKRKELTQQEFELLKEMLK